MIIAGHLLDFYGTLFFNDFLGCIFYRFLTKNDPNSIDRKLTGRNPRGHFFVKMDVFFLSRSPGQIFDGFGSILVDFWLNFQ